MPELPEVETVARDLRPLLIGRTVESVERSKKALRKPWRAAWASWLVARRVTDVCRRGKWLAIELDNGTHLVIHLGMTGQLTVKVARWPRENHTHLVFGLDDNNELRFRDVRRFGSATCFKDKQAWERNLDGLLGPEPWDMPPDAWRSRLASTDRNLKAILLDQAIIAGVGNIYTDEACYAAGLRPTRTGRSLQKSEADRLLAAIRDVLTQAIESRGSTIRDYVGGSGLSGEFQERFAAYGRKDQPCHVCGQPIECVRLAGRSTHYCRRCQR